MLAEYRLVREDGTVVQDWKVAISEGGSKVAVTFDIDGEVEGYFQVEWIAVEVKDVYVVMRSSGGSPSHPVMVFDFREDAVDYCDICNKRKTGEYQVQSVSMKVYQ